MYQNLQIIFTKYFTCKLKKFAFILIIIFSLASLSGNVGVLHVLESEENLEWVLNSGPHSPYLVILEAPLFTRYCEGFTLYFSLYN